MMDGERDEGWTDLATELRPGFHKLGRVRDKSMLPKKNLSAHVGALDTPDRRTYASMAPAVVPAISEWSGFSFRVEAMISGEKELPKSDQLN